MSKLGIPDRLKEARKKLNLNQLVIATDLGIHQKTISEIENGKILNIPNTYIYYFYKKGINLEWIYDAKEPMLREGADSSSANENKSMALTLDNLFENINQTEKEDIKPMDLMDMETGEAKNNGMYERLIDSKDMTIKSLLTYVQSVENNLDFIKSLLIQEK